MAATLFATAAPALAGTVTANFTSASTVPVTAASYTATGNDVALSLGFAPPVGTNLTVVNNTGLPYIHAEMMKPDSEYGVYLGQAVISIADWTDESFLPYRSLKELNRKLSQRLKDEHLLGDERGK